MIRFNPVLSILIGFIASLVIFGIYLGFHLNSGFRFFLFFISFIVGGFLATFLSKERKIRYGILVGMLMILPAATLPKTSVHFIETIIMTIILTGLGSFIAKITDKNLWKDGFSPILAILFGFVAAVAFNIFWIFLVNQLNFMISELIGISSFLIGAFLTTFLVKEKKIQFSFYEGFILLITFIIFWAYVDVITVKNYFNYINLSIIYIFCTFVGGYLGIMVAKRFKINKSQHNK